MNGSISFKEKFSLNVHQRQKLKICTVLIADTERYLLIHDRLRVYTHGTYVSDRTEFSRNFVENMLSPTVIEPVFYT